MSQTASHKPAKTPAALSTRRVRKAMERLAGTLEKDSMGLPTIRIPGGRMSIGVNDELGGLSILGYWGGSVCFDPDRQPLRMDVNDFNGGGISGNLVAEPCGSHSSLTSARFCTALPAVDSNEFSAQEHYFWICEVPLGGLCALR